MRNSLIFTSLLIGIVFVSDLDAQRRSKRSSKRMQDVQNEEIKEASGDLAKQYGFSSRKEMVEHLLSQNLSRSERRIVEKFSDGQKLNGREQKRLEQFLQKYPQGEQGAVSNRSGRSSRSGRGERSARSSRSGRKTRDTSKRTTRQGRQQVQADDAPVVSGLDFGFSGSVERPPEDDASSGLQSGRRSGRSATDLVPTADEMADTLDEVMAQLMNQGGDFVYVDNGALAVSEDAEEFRWSVRISESGNFTVSDPESELSLAWLDGGGVGLMSTPEIVLDIGEEFFEEEEIEEFQSMDDEDQEAMQEELLSEFGTSVDELESMDEEDLEVDMPEVSGNMQWSLVPVNSDDAGLRNALVPADESVDGIALYYADDENTTGDAPSHEDIVMDMPAAEGDAEAAAPMSGRRSGRLVNEYSTSEVKYYDRNQNGVVDTKRWREGWRKRWYKRWYIRWNSSSRGGWYPRWYYNWRWYLAPKWRSENIPEPVISLSEEGGEVTVTLDEASRWQVSGDIHFDEGEIGVGNVANALAGDDQVDSDDPIGNFEIEAGETSITVPVDMPEDSQPAELHTFIPDDRYVATGSNAVLSAPPDDDNYSSYYNTFGDHNIRITYVSDEMRVVPYYMMERSMKFCAEEPDDHDDDLYDKCFGSSRYEDWHGGGINGVINPSEGGKHHYAADNSPRGSSQKVEWHLPNEGETNPSTYIYKYIDSGTDMNLSNALLVMLYKHRNHDDNHYTEHLPESLFSYGSDANQSRFHIRGADCYHDHGDVVSTMDPEDIRYWKPGDWRIRIKIENSDLVAAEGYDPILLSEFPSVQDPDLEAHQRGGEADTEWVSASPSQIALLWMENNNTDLGINTAVPKCPVNNHNGYYLEETSMGDNGIFYDSNGSLTKFWLSSWWWNYDVDKNRSDNEDLQYINHFTHNSVHALNKQFRDLKIKFQTELEENGYEGVYTKAIDSFQFQVRKNRAWGPE